RVVDHHQQVDVRPGVVPVAAGRGTVQHHRAARVGRTGQSIDQIRQGILQTGILAHQKLLPAPPPLRPPPPPKPPKPPPPKPPPNPPPRPPPNPPPQIIGLLQLLRDRW